MEKQYNRSDISWKIIDDFLCGGQKMVIIGMSGDTCIMPKEDYNRIIIAERKYKKRVNDQKRPERIISCQFR